MSAILVNDFLTAYDNKYDEVKMSISYVESIQEKITNKVNMTDIIGSIIVTDGIISSIKTEIVQESPSEIYCLERVSLKKGGAKWIGILVYNSENNGVMLQVMTTDKDATIESMKKEVINSFCHV